MRCGYFDDQAREYVITDPRTPVKWINYVGTLAFGGFVDHTGGALLCRGDPATDRITRYLALQPASDFKGTTLYLRTGVTGLCTVSSPFYVPTLEPLDVFECHVGLGYTRIISSRDGLQTTATFFVPRNDTRLVIDVRIANLGAATLELRWSRAARMRFSETGPSVPRVWAKRLTRSSSSIQRTSATSAPERRAGGRAATASR